MDKRCSWVEMKDVPAHQLSPLGQPKRSHVQTAAAMSALAGKRPMMVTAWLEGHCDFPDNLHRLTTCSFSFNLVTILVWIMVILLQYYSHMQLLNLSS